MNLVLACGSCRDAILDSNFWWLALTPFLVLGLLAEGAVFAVVTWVRKLESVSPRAFPAALAAGLFILSFLFAGMLVAFTIVASILLAAAGWSLFRNHRFSPALTGIRVALITMGLVAGLWTAWPTHRSLDDLVDGAITMTRFRANDGWLFDELRRRPDAIAAVERRADGESDSSVLKLHRTLGGSPAFRLAKCSQWTGRKDFDEVCR